jgi:hypothetical protein
MEPPKTTTHVTVDNTSLTDEQKQALADKGVESLYELHELVGKRVKFEEESGVIVAAWQGRFTAHLDSDGREPVGAIAHLTSDAAGQLIYRVPK